MTEETKKKWTSVLARVEALKESMSTVDACKKVGISRQTYYSARAELKRAGDPTKVISYSGAATGRVRLNLKNRAVPSRTMTLVTGTPEQLAAFFREVQV